MRRIPRDSNIAINHLLVAAFRRDWREAGQRWDTLTQQFPDDPKVKAGWPTIRYQLELADVDVPLSPHGDAAAWPHREFFLQFASLGDNCEFGFVQRHYGAEPLDLLRWTGISYDRLLQGLQTGFEGLGSPENAVVAPDPENIEYHLVDTTLDLEIHTSMFVGEEAPDRVLDKTCIRLRFLRTKLCRDLQTAEKIFVFLSRSPLEASQCHALHAAIRSYGPSRLLCVRPHDATHPPGLVEMDAEGVLHGFLDHTGNDGTRWGEISYDLWRLICKRAYHLHTTHSKAGLDDAGKVVSQTELRGPRLAPPNGGRNEMAKTRGTGLLMVWTDIAAEHEAAFNQWYDEEHIHRLLRIPGVLSAGRYVAVRGGPKYLALYELEDHHVMQSSAFIDEVRYTPSPDRQRAAGGSVGHNYLLNLYRQIFPLRTNPVEATMGPSPVLQMGRIDVPAHYDEEFNDWYNTAYIPPYLQVPGVLRARRFTAIEGQPKYLTLYEFADVGVPDTPAWDAARNSNPWSDRIRPIMRHDRGSPGGLSAHLPELTRSALSSPYQCKARE